MSLPSRPGIQVPSEDIPAAITRSIGTDIKILDAYKSRDFMMVLESEESVASLEVDKQVMDQINLDPGGVIFTAKTADGKSADFVSRYFTPQCDLFEDPVTGSAHCTLVPYWAGKLNKDKLTAKQVSKRVGHLHCENQTSKVLVTGQAITYLEGHVYV